MAAILNLFFPGLGYLYVGIGRNGKLMVFGLLIFLSVAVVFYAGVVGAFVYPSTPPRSSLGPLEYVSLFALILPIALSYDGYQRAKSS